MNPPTINHSRKSYSQTLMAALLFALCPSLRAATVTWIGGNGDWGATTNWSTGNLPGSSDDVVIGSGGSITVTHSTGTDMVRSIQSQQPFVLSGGVLSVATSFQAFGGFTLSGGTLQNAALSGSAGLALIVSSGTFDGVTVNGVLDVGSSVSAAYLYVTNQLALNGTALVGGTNGNYGALVFLGNNVLGGVGTVIFGNSNPWGNGSANGLLVGYGGNTLVIGSSITVRGAAGTIGADSYPWSTPGNVVVVNQGTISADVNGGIMVINAAPFNNQGMVQVINGDTLTFSGAWSNNRVISETASTLNLGGSFSLGTGSSLAGTNGAIYLTGTLNNTNAPLTLSAATGSWTLDGGDIAGGTVATKDGTPLIVNWGTLDGVTVNGVLDVGITYNRAVLGVTNGLTLNGTILVGSTNGTYGGIGFAGNQVLEGSGTVVFGNSGCNALWLSYDASTLVIGSGVTVHGQTGQIGYAPSCWGTPQDVTLVNQGTILADVGGGTININANPFNNLGVAQAINGGTLSLSGAWNNNNTISQSGGTLYLGGNFSLANGGVPLGTNGTIYVSGTLNNSNAVLTLNAATGPWVLSGGTVAGGTLLTKDNSVFVVQNGTFNGVTVNGILDIGGSNNAASLTVTNQLVLNGTAVVGGTNGSYGAMVFAGNEVLQGTGTVVFGSSGCNALCLANPATTLVISSGITVRGQTGQIGYAPSCWGSPSNVGIVNQGIISADVSGGMISINAVPFNNLGLAQATNGGTLQLAGSWSNLGRLAASGGTLNLGGGFSGAALGTVQGAGGVVSISGVVSNTAQMLVLDGAVGSWGLNGGAIHGGTIMSTNRASLVVSSGTLDAATLDGILDVGYSVNGASLSVSNGLTLNGTAFIGNPTNYAYGVIGFAGTQSLTGNGTIVFGNAPQNGLLEVIGGASLTIGPAIILRGQNGLIGASAAWPFYGATNVTIVCEGTISADVSGGVLTARGQPFLFQGLLTTPAGALDLGYVENAGNTFLADATTGSLNLSGGWIHGGTIQLSNDVRLVIGNVTLDGVVVNGSLDVGNQISGAILTVTNGLTLNGTAFVGNPTSQSYGNIAFGGTQVLDGQATVVFGQSPYNALRVMNDGTSLTLAPLVTVRGQIGSIGAGWPWGVLGNVSVTNLGTITAEASSGAILIGGGRFENQGLVEVKDGGNLQATSSNTVNTGTIRIDRAFLTFPNNFTQSSGTLDFGLIGPNQSGWLALNGAASVGGTLAVHLLDGLIPAPGDSFSLMTFGSNTVGFSNFDLPGPELWQINATNGNFRLSVSDDFALEVSISPASATVAAGSQIQFKAIPNQLGDFAFQWQFNGNDLPNSTDSTLSLGALTKASSGLYSVVVQGGGLSATSAPAQLTVLAAPAIVQAPVPKTVHVGDTVILNVVANGDVPLSYTWLFNGLPITWASGPSLTLSDVGRPQGGTYAVLVTNLVGSVTSAPVAVTIATGPGCSGAPSGLIAWWRGEGDAYDYAGTNDLDFIGAAYAPGIAGQAFALDGSSSYLTAMNNASPLAGTNDFAIELWANFAAVPPSIIGGDGSAPFIGCDGGVGVQNKWFFGQGGGQLYFYLNGPEVGAHFLAQAPFLPVTNVWYHLALTRQSSVYRAYVNGVQLAAETNGLPIPPVDAPLTIGGAQGLYMNGLLDEISVYGRALQASELLAIYRAGAQGKCGLQSGSGLSLQAQLDNTGKLQIMITGDQVGITLAVEATQDFKQWTTLGQVSKTQPIATFTDPTITPPSWRYYRVLVNP